VLIVVALSSCSSAAGDADEFAVVVVVVIDARPTSSSSANGLCSIRNFVFRNAPFPPPTPSSWQSSSSSVYS